MSESTNLAPDTPPAENAGAVRQLQARLRQAFSDDGPWRKTANEDCLAVLQRFLELTDWAQGPRRIFESMPHADDVASVAAFRTVLFRLGYSSTAEPASAANLRSEYLPCFLSTPDGCVKLAEEVSRDGEIVVFDPADGSRQHSAPDAVEALAIFPEKIEDDDKKSGPAAPTWSSTVIDTFRPLIKRIFLISFVVNILALAPPIFVMAVYDKAVGTKSLDVLIGLSVGILFIVSADFLLRQVRVHLQSYLGARLDEQLNETAFRHLLHLSLSHTEDAPIGSQLTRLRQMTSLHEALRPPVRR